MILLRMLQTSKLFTLGGLNEVFQLTYLNRRSADEFMDELQPFLRTIRSVRDSCKPWEVRKRIRIAVLDSGIDDTQPIMDSATRHGRINCQASRSFVHRADSWRQDSYGHGTHVTQLLLKTAPTAEIIIGKICTDKVIDADFMPAITQVCCPGGTVLLPETSVLTFHSVGNRLGCRLLRRRHHFHVLWL